jgi:hypothetical protein
VRNNRIIVYVYDGELRTAKERGENVHLYCETDTRAGSSARRTRDRRRSACRARCALDSRFRIPRDSRYRPPTSLVRGRV